jgi:hypothetical protein
MLLTWRYAHVVRRPVADAGPEYDEPASGGVGREASARGRGQTVIPRFSQTSPTSMPTF